MQLLLTMYKSYYVILSLKCCFTQAMSAIKILNFLSKMVHCSHIIYDGIALLFASWGPFTRLPASAGTRAT